MAIAESDVKHWITKACAMVDGHLLDYIAISIPSSRTARSFVEHAIVKVDQKSADIVCSEAWDHITNIIASAEMEGKAEVCFKILLYRAKAPAGSRTWRTDTGPNAYQSEHDDNETGSITSMSGALVAAMRELRMGNRDLTEAVMKAAGEGWKLAGLTLEREREMNNKLHDTELALALTGNDDDEIKKLGVKVASEFIDVMKVKSLMKIQSDAAQASAVTDKTQDAKKE
jgi:hypothetical protein